MNAKTTFAFLLVVATLVGLALAQLDDNNRQAPSGQQQQQGQQQGGNPNCPIRRTMNALDSIQSMFGRMTQQVSQQLRSLPTPAGLQRPAREPTSTLARQKRQASLDMGLQQQQQQQQQQLPQQPQLLQYQQPQQQRQQQQPQYGGAPKQASARDMAIYNQTISEHESRLNSLMRQMMSSPYMPTRDQAIQLATTVLSLLLMMLLGPAMGTQAGVIQAMVKQVVPLIVAATVHYAADRAAPMSPMMAAPITEAQIAPVPAQASMLGQAF